MYQVSRHTLLLYTSAYTPLTEEGNILVDEVLASCYAVVDHDLGQLMMAPIKWFSETMQMIFGEDGGIPALVKISWSTWNVLGSDNNFFRSDRCYFISQIYF